MPQSPDIEQSSNRDISDFWISGWSLIKEICCNSRTRDDIDMKLGPITKLDKRNKTMSKKTWQWCHVRKLCHHYHFPNLLPIWSNPEASIYTTGLSKDTIFAKKCLFFAKNTDISKIKRALALKGIFSKPIYVCTYMPYISNIILKSFRQGGGGGVWGGGGGGGEGEFQLPPSQNEPLKHPPRLGLNCYIDVPKHFQ